MSDLLFAIILFLYAYIDICIHITGINRSSKQDDINQEILLRLSNVPKDVPISQISDVDFSEVLLLCQQYFLMQYPPILKPGCNQSSIFQVKMKLIF